ncbi:hypothetical protein SH1V18_38700 [Vallitalea longa]|uniref:Uncharacterized protein n=1 Tax=Vallitalea longa TaxID=2936439 RepID=A0A9W5YCB4_9FIRM|nr:DUF6133 family protein [Vallitalea longa]GKX31390.1 hypothetical protein SH1V18_38700 [Vallitalea longa]
MRNYLIKIHIKGINTMDRVKEIMKSNKGEGFIDSALKILISVVVGGLLLSGLYMLFKDTVLPTLTDKITNMFDFKG